MILKKINYYYGPDTEYQINKIWWDKYRGSCALPLLKDNKYYLVSITEFKKAVEFNRLGEEWLLEKVGDKCYV